MAHTSSSAVTNRTINWVEQGLVPDPMVRAGIRRLLRQRLLEVHADDIEQEARLTDAFANGLRDAPLALVPHKANEQHYEVPADFFGHVLGQHRKYSSCWWGPGVATLDEAEARALALTCDHAGLADGQRVLELGCGWGSLTLWVAQRHPRSRITAVSNSDSQREYIQAEAARRGLVNVHVVTCDMNRFDTDERFDRVVSVEMFEHMRNWPALFAAVARWLRPQGRFFLHVFTHRGAPYEFVERDASDWMTRHFFAGGMMPSDDLALHFQDDLRLRHRWRWDGRHYERTANAWLDNQDRARTRLWPLMEGTYGRDQAAVAWSRWRLFFMSCAELFGYERGQRWGVSHYLFEPPRSACGASPRGGDTSGPVEPDPRCPLGSAGAMR